MSAPRSIPAGGSFVLGQPNAIAGASRSLAEAAAHNSGSDQPQLNNNRAARGPASGDASRLAELLRSLTQRPGKNPYRTSHNSPSGTYEERFWARVQKGSDCWLWTGPRNQFGYGQFSFRGHSINAQRVSFAIAYGVPASGLCVCHRCDVRHCVRPDHLFAGTVGDNLRDMTRKGRHPEQVTKQTHCKRGHAYTPENTRRKRDGMRSCKACERLRRTA